MAQPDARFHAVLIGIDAYRSRPLHGCVNDVDAVQRLLIERAGVPADRVRRLASPHPGARHDPSVPETPATLANIRAALDALAAQVQDGDRVFIYYSGHGTRVPFSHPRGYAIHREALVPADVDAAWPQRLLFDHELNALLAGLARRTRAVTCVLDCCHSASVTRDPGLPGGRPRSLDPVRHLGWIPQILTSAPDPARGEGGAGGARSFGDCHVVSACLDFELAMEAPGDDGVPRGLFTHALLRALAGIPDPELRSVPWARIWQAVRADVERRNPWQHPSMTGPLARAILAGPPVGGDPGLAIRRAGDAYELDAGTLASVTEAAQIAVYDAPGHLPPPLGSPEDLAARRGLLRVTSAELASARAEAIGAPFELAPGARGRVVEAGRAARLRCAIVPPDEAIAAALGGSPLLEVVGALEAQVRLVAAGGRWLLTDDVHDETEAGALVALRPEELGYARAVLEHYHQYALPLRMAESVRDLPGALALEVLACERELAGAAAQVADLPEAPTEGRSAYELRAGARICFRVRNTSGVPLLVTLLNSAASGRVQLLGKEVIDVGGAAVIWAGAELGRPFVMTLPPGRPQGIDRLVAIGTTAVGRDLGYLRVDQRFCDVLTPTRSREDRISLKDLGCEGPPLEQWTATRAMLRTRAG